MYTINVRRNHFHSYPFPVHHGLHVFDGRRKALPVAKVDFDDFHGYDGTVDYIKDIADEYPDVYFGSIIASDLTTKRNFIRLFPRQYQALYLEGLIAAALTETGNIGVVSAFPGGQVIRRQAGFTLGVQDDA